MAKVAAWTREKVRSRKELIVVLDQALMHVEGNAYQNVLGQLTGSLSEPFEFEYEGQTVQIHGRNRLQRGLDLTSLPSPPAPSMEQRIPSPPSPLLLSPLFVFNSSSATDRSDPTASSSGVSSVPSGSGSPATSSTSSSDMPVLRRYDEDDSDGDHQAPEDSGIRGEFERDPVDSMMMDTSQLEEPDTGARVTGDVAVVPKEFEVLRAPEIDPVDEMIMDTSQLEKPDTGVHVTGDDVVMESQLQPDHNGAALVGNSGLDEEEEVARESCRPPTEPEPDYNCDVPATPKDGHVEENIEENNIDDPGEALQVKNCNVRVVPEADRVGADVEKPSAPEIAPPEAPMEKKVRKVPQRRRKRKSRYGPPSTPKGKKPKFKSVIRRLGDYLATVEDKFDEIRSSNQPTYDIKLKCENLVEKKANMFFDELRQTNGSRDEEKELDRLADRLNTEHMKMQRKLFEITHTLMK